MSIVTSRERRALFQKWSQRDRRERDL